MAWIWQKVDAVLDGLVMAAAGVTASQAEAFVVQYVQRLGGHLDEAKAHLDTVQHGLRYQLMSDTVRAELETDAKTRVAALQHTYNAIADANILIKPFAFMRHQDPGLVAGTWHDFVPALPTSAESIVYVIIAMILATLVYEAIKLPVTTLLQEPRRRKFRRRG